MSEPFQMPKPVNRNDHEESEVTHRPAEEPKKVERESKPMSHSRNSFDSKSRAPLAVVAVVVVLLLAVAGWRAWSNMGGGNGIDGGKYQAVFFTNGQVYFGKLHAFSNDYLKLDKIFYIQAQTASTDTKNP